MASKTMFQYTAPTDNPEFRAPFKCLGSPHWSLGTIFMAGPPRVSRSQASIRQAELASPVQVNKKEMSTKKPCSRARSHRELADREEQPR